MVTNNFFSKSFLETIKTVHENDDNKFVIILGSGFHGHYLSKVSDREEDDSLQMLCDWEKLLQPLSSDYPFTGHYLRDFEDIITNSQNSKNDGTPSVRPELAAFQIENSFHKQIQLNLKSVQNTVINEYAAIIPLWLFNPAIISDVVSLNFDLIPEILLNKSKKAPLPIKVDSIAIKSDVNITRHRAVDGINFWHPHGDIGSCGSMVLSLRKYGMILPQVELLRKHFKANEYKTNQKKTSYTWFDRISKQPILIIGASISDLEWDIWFALANRKRNFAKGLNKKHEKSIFKMSGPCEKIENNWFSSLTTKKERYDSQWDRLEPLFNNF